MLKSVGKAVEPWLMTLSWLYLENLWFQQDGAAQLIEGNFYWAYCLALCATKNVRTIFCLGSMKLLVYEDKPPETIAAVEGNIRLVIADMRLKLL